MARHRYMREGLLGPVAQTRRPAQVIGVRQHGGEVMPPVCSRCHAHWSEMSLWYAHCRVCGEYFYRTVGEVLPPVKTHPPRHTA
jgi:predicted amidophosphoribosyltransferase